MLYKMKLYKKETELHILSHYFIDFLLFGLCGESFVRYNLLNKAYKSEAYIIRVFDKKLLCIYVVN